MSSSNALRPLQTAELGDLVVLPDGSSHSLRSRVVLSTPSRGLSGFCVLGECQIVVTTASVEGAPIGVYLPGVLPQGVQVHEIAEGASRYWAPHLPSVSGAMGELLWRVVGVPGFADPVVVLFRGPEVIPFIHTSFAWPADVSRLALDRGVDNDRAVDRHAAKVITRESQFSPEEILFEEFVTPGAR